MKKSNGLILAALSCLSVVSMCAVAYGNSGDSLFEFMSSAQEVPNMLTINKMSARSGGKVTANTEKGNTVDFSYSRFDTRPGTTDYNNCIAFYKTLNDLGGYIKNDTALYSVKTIKIYSYSPADPEPTTLTTAKFNIYYGFEPVNVDRSNSAKVTIKNGTYTFKDGYEPSYIGIETIENFDVCVSKVEITYKCSPVEGTIKTMEGPAYKYDYVGKEFTTSGGNKIAYNVTEAAPWQHLEGLDDTSKVNTRGTVVSNYDPSTQIWSTNKSGVNFVDFTPNANDEIVGTDTRKIISATVTMSHPKGTAWGTMADLYFGVNGDTAGYGASRLCDTNILGGTQVWEDNARIVSVVDEAGNDMTGKSIVDKKVTINYDASNCSKNIINVTFGTSLADIFLTIHDVSIKSTLCGHAAYESRTSDHAYQYEGEGTYEICPECGEILSTRTNYTNPAPWVRLKGFLPATSTTVNNGDNTYTNAAAGWDNSVYYYLPKNLEGRTQLAITFAAPSSTWDTYFFIGNEKGNQIVTASEKINWGENAMITEVLGPTGSSLNYNASTYSVGASVGTNLTTIIYDLTKASASMEGALIRLSLYTAGTYTAYVDLRTPCDHSNTESFSTGSNCGVRCSECGRLVTSYVNNINSYTPAGHSDVMTYETGVTFDGRENCLKTRTTEYTNNADMGWAVNYKVYYRGLVKNARSANKPLIKLHFYVKAASNFDIRMGWGVGNNTSGAQADHYNAATTSLTGSSIVPSNSSIVAENGTSTNNKAPANQWLVLTLDVSSDDFAGIDDFWIIGNFDINKTNYPIETYVSSVSVEAKAE